MAQQRRYERDQFRDEDEQQDWTYGRGRESGYGEGFGRGRESRYSEGRGWGGDYRSSMPGYAGERAARYGSGYASESYGPSERYGWRDEASRGEPRYGGEGRWGQERDMWDRASDEVSSWFGDEEAERRRRMDKFRGRGPKNYARSEERIREDVCDRLTDEGAVDASEIEVAVSGTEVTLSGTVPSRDQRRRAEICAERVSGVTHVQNNMRVEDRTGDFTPTGLP